MASSPWVSQAAQRLGVPEATLQQAVGAILVFLQNRQQQSDYNDDTSTRSYGDVLNTIIAALGAQAWMRQAQQSSSSSSSSNSSSSRSPSVSATTVVGLILFLLQLFGIWNILRQLFQRYHSDVGLRILQAMEDGVQLDRLLSQYGISHEQGIVLFGFMFDYLQQKVSPETLQQLIRLVPALQAFLDESGRPKHD